MEKIISLFKGVGHWAPPKKKKKKKKVGQNIPFKNYHRPWQPCNIYKKNFKKNYKNIKKIKNKKGLVEYNVIHPLPILSHF
jgi:hypothetical protein